MTNQFNDAISNLMIALKEVKKIANSEDSSNLTVTRQVSAIGSPSTEGCSTISTPDSQCCCDDNIIEFENLCRSTTRLPLSSSPQRYIYQSPIPIYESVRVHKQPSITCISFHIMFNLALAHHMKGIFSGTDVSGGSILVSKRLYELTFQMQAQESETNLLLMAALLNNLSIVHKVLGNDDEMARCQHLLLSTLLLLVDMGERTLVESSGFQVDMEGFMGNVLHLMSTESPVANAA